MKNLTLTLFALIITFHVSAQIEDEFSKDIRKFFEINGTRQTIPLVMDQMITQVKPLFPSVPDKYWSVFKEEMSGNGMEDFYKEIIPIYKKYFTHQEIRDIIDFYETPTGRKFSEKTPFVTQEAMLVGQKWGSEIGQKIIEKLEEKGYKKI
jgi:uncharacterized protein